MATANFGNTKKDLTSINMENGDFKFESSNVHKLQVEASGSVAGTFLSLNASSIKAKGNLDISGEMKRSDLILTGDSKIHVGTIDSASSISGIGTNKIYSARMDGSIDASAMTGGTVSLGLSSGKIQGGAGTYIEIAQMTRGSLDDAKGSQITVGVIGPGAEVNISGQDSSSIRFNTLSGRLNLENASYTGAKSAQIQHSGNFGSNQVKIGGQYVNSAGVSLTNAITVDDFGKKPEDFLTRQSNTSGSGTTEPAPGGIMPPLIGVIVATPVVALNTASAE
jgi:hypothetical protein